MGLQSPALGIGGPKDGFHDWLCMSREMIDSVERYIEYNALKWWLRNGGGRSLMALEAIFNTPNWWEERELTDSGTRGDYDDD